MNTSDLEKYLKLEVDGNAVDAKIIDPGSVITGEWVTWKCQFGCFMYGRGYCCPPETPTSEQTRKMIDCYQRAILFHMEFPNEKGVDNQKIASKLNETLTDLEGEIFKDGFYKAFIFLGGPWSLCAGWSKLKGEPCSLGNRARPAMEACGIDVYQTARNNGFFIKTLRDTSETRRRFCLMLVD